MIKLVSSVLFLIGSTFASFCPIQPITSNTIGENLPYGAANLTTVPQGTNCTFKFDIPNNYILKLNFNVQAGSFEDEVIIYDNNYAPLYNLQISTTPMYNVPLYLPARAASVRVVAVSGNMQFMLSYLYQNLNNYNQVGKGTGEHFSLSTVATNTYVTITTSSFNERVIVSPASRVGVTDQALQYFYVFDGDNINTANVMGRLSDFSDIRISSGQSVSIVNFAGVSSESYVLGNDASTLDGFGKYTVLLTSFGSSTSMNIEEYFGSTNGVAYTWICTDCSTFYWTDLKFDSLNTVANKAYVSFQGQTPTHKLEKLIRYDAMTLTDSYFPQILPTNVFTINLYLGKVAFRMNNINDDSNWKKVYPGRKGYIFAPSLWGPVANDFNYEFRDDSRWYSFTVKLNKLSFPINGDKMTLKIGSGNEAPTLNNTYPTTQISNPQAAAVGNYMKVGLDATYTADVRLFFEIKPSSTVTTSTVQSTSTVQTTTSSVGDNDIKMLISIVVLMILV